MSVRVMSWVWEHSASKGVDRLVLLAIADHAHDDGASAYPSVHTLAKKTQVDRRTVLRSLERLEASGEVEIDRNFGRVNRYRVVMSNQCQPATSVSVPPVAESHRTSDSVPRDQWQPATLTIKNHQPTITFDAWYDEYPKKVGKKAAKKSYDKAVKEVDADHLLDKTKAFARSCVARKVDKQYIPNPATWLNQGRWDDEDLDGRPNRERKPWE